MVGQQLHLFHPRKGGDVLAQSGEMILSIRQARHHHVAHPHGHVGRPHRLHKGQGGVHVPAGDGPVALGVEVFDVVEHQVRVG